MDIVLNGVTLQGDLMDADFVEVFEAAMREVMTTAKAGRKAQYPTVAAGYRAQCELVNTCLDKIFGAGTAEKVFQGKMNIREHFQVLQDLSDWAANERKAFNDLANRYTQRQRAFTQQERIQQYVGGPHGKGKGKDRH